MKRHSFWPVALALSVLAPAAAFADAPAPTPPAAAPVGAKPHHGGNVNGKVTNIAGNMLTIQNRRNPTGTTVTLASNAKVWLTSPAAIPDLAVGDYITANGTPEADGKTLDAKQIMLAPAPPHPHKPRPGATFTLRNNVTGTVATTTPSLTITTPGAQTVTLNTTGATKVIKLTQGTASDITAGALVQAHTQGDEASPTATEVRILPAHQGKK